MAHPSTFIALAPLRRAIAAVLRGGRLPERDALVVQRLSLDTRTCLRLPVGLRVADIGDSTVSTIVGTLSDLEVGVGADDLRRALVTARPIADRLSHTVDPHVLTPKACRLQDDHAAAELMRLCEQHAGEAALLPTVRGRLAVLHLLGAHVECVPNFAQVVRAWTR